MYSSVSCCSGSSMQLSRVLISVSFSSMRLPTMSSMAYTWLISDWAHFK